MVHRVPALYSNCDNGIRDSHVTPSDVLHMDFSNRYSICIHMYLKWVYTVSGSANLRLISSTQTVTIQRATFFVAAGVVYCHNTVLSRLKLSSHPLRIFLSFHHFYHDNNQSISTTKAKLYDSTISHTFKYYYIDRPTNNRLYKDFGTTTFSCGIQK